MAELDHLADPAAGELRIGSSEAVPAGLLSAVIDKLAMRHPRLTFEVTLGAGLTDLQYSELQAHNLDLIIGRLPSVIPNDAVVRVLDRPLHRLLACRLNYDAFARLEGSADEAACPATRHCALLP